MSLARLAAMRVVVAPLLFASSICFWACGGKEPEPLAPTPGDRPSGVRVTNVREPLPDGGTPPLSTPER